MCWASRPWHVSHLGAPCGDLTHLQLFSSIRLGCHPKSVGHEVPDSYRGTSFYIEAWLSEGGVVVYATSAASCINIIDVLSTHGSPLPQNMGKLSDGHNNATPLGCMSGGIMTYICLPGNSGTVCRDNLCLAASQHS